MRQKKAQNTKITKKAKKSTAQSTQLTPLKVSEQTLPMNKECVSNWVGLLDWYPDPRDRQNPEFIYQILKRGLENITETRMCQLFIAINYMPEFKRNPERVMKNVFRTVFGAYAIPISPIGLIQILALTAHEDRSPLDHEAEDLNMFSNFTPADRTTLYILRPFLGELMV